MMRKGGPLEPLRYLTSRIKAMYSGDPKKYSKEQWNDLFSKKVIKLSKTN